MNTNERIVEKSSQGRPWWANLTLDFGIASAVVSAGGFVMGAPAVGVIGLVLALAMFGHAFSAGRSKEATVTPAAPPSSAPRQTVELRPREVRPPRYISQAPPPRQGQRSRSSRPSGSHSDSGGFFGAFGGYDGGYDGGSSSSSGCSDGGGGGCD